jgi:hypothetical protein
VIMNAQIQRRLRGQILRLLRESHEAQRPRLDDVTLAGVLERLQFDVTVNLVKTLVEDLGQRQLLKYERERDLISGKVSLRRIQILPRGRDVLDGIEVEKSVELID